MQQLLFRKTSWLLLAGAVGCTAPASEPPAAAYGAPLAVVASEGRFSGTWHKRNSPLFRSCLDTLRISHDTLGRYNINEIPCDTFYSTDAYTGYATGDFLRVAAVPEHHALELWLHIEQGKQLLIMTYQLDAIPGHAPPPLTRDTFWLDPVRARQGRPNLGP